jgi:hypothetical protein
VDLRRGTGGQVGEGDVLKGVRTVAGGRGDDRLLGDDKRNVLTGGPGFDRLAGRGGDDELNPNRGGSRLHCGAGMDEVVATSHKDRLAIDCESLGDNTRARPTPAAAGTLHYRADCEKRSDDESLVIGECSARLLVRRVGGRRAVLAAGAIPLHRWHTATLSLKLTRAGQRLAAQRGAVTAALTLREHENGWTTVRRWSTRVVLQR